MNSPQGSARTPARLDRDESISPLPLDTTIDTHLPPSSSSNSVLSDDVHETTVTTASPPFTQLTPTIISRILWAVDANSFASLCVLNRQWHAEAQKVELYAHHLSRCPSYALSNSIISGPFKRNDLSRIKAKFAAEVRRNLFDAYLHPRRTFINLISINANSSAAFPTGEAFRFEFSPNARTILALNSSRIYVLDATTSPPRVKRHLKTVRRPLSASITDDGSLLAVLSSKHQVNIYGLTPQGVKHLQVIVLDNPPKIIAIAHEGTVLAASFETGIEVFSLAANSLTTDRRAVRSEAVDTLSFSGDGSMLVGSSLSLDDPNAVVISAPFYTENDPDLSPREIHSRMWTTQILFPQISSVCSHVALLPGHNEGDACWLFAFDHSLMSYRAVRTDDTRTGVAYFLSPPGADRFDTLIPTIAPSASVCGTLAVAAFEGAGLWLYGIPERLDVSPDMGAVIERQNERQPRNHMPLTSATGNMEPLMAYSPSATASDYSIEDDSLASKVDWRQSLFVKCKNLNGLSGQTAARWVESGDGSSIQTSKRLVVVAPGGVTFESDDLGDESMPVDGSRMCLLDFDYVPSTSSDHMLTIEVGEEETELLTEHTGTLATEVAMERRRTIRAIPTVEGTQMPLGRSVTSISPPAMPLFEDGIRRGSVSTPSSPVEPSRSSQIYAASGLHRAATASGFRHARYPPRPPLGSSQTMDQGSMANQRANFYGRPISEDSWETPPPPYISGNSPSPHQSHVHTAANRGGQTQPRVSLQTGNSMPQAMQPQYRPYRALAAERASPTIDMAMSSHAVPSGATINQYGELVMASRLSMSNGGSPNMNAGLPWSPPSPPDTGLNNQSSFIPRRRTDPVNDVRPITQHSMPSSGWQGLGRNTTIPLSSNNPDAPQISAETPNAFNPTNMAAVHRLSLTGANLQNRLNHPVPPIPENPKPFEHPAHYADPAYHPANRPAIHPTEDANAYPSMPTADQMVNLNRRMSNSEAQRPPAIKNTNFVHRNPTHGVPPSPPRGAWGATGVPGSPTINQARNVPNGFSRSRSNSRESQISNFASASAPNLLTQRPKYGRLDTIESINDMVIHGDNSFSRRSRAHSMTQPPVMINSEPSAYYETSTAGPPAAMAKFGKKSKKKKEEPARKGSRCIVM